MSDQIKQFIDEFLKLIELEIEEIEITESENDTYKINIVSPKDGALIIGKHGETLRSLQSLIQVMLNVKFEKKVYIVLDTENYKTKQEENITSLADRKARKVLETGESELMPPMNPYYRRIIHTYFSSNEEFNDIKTESIGEGLRRQVKIFKD